MIIAYNATSYPYCCQTTCSRLISYWLIVYSGSSIVGDDGGGDSNMSSSVGSNNWLSESTNPMLDLFPGLYSDSNIFFCKG